MMTRLFSATCSCPATTSLLAHRPFLQDADGGHVHECRSRHHDRSEGDIN
jgi:hypothetical protein